MRNLVILRGAPGCGKSTFIERNNLKQYTISSDDIRLLITGPELDVNGKFCIPQNINKRTFELLHSLLEERMKRGEFVIIDATHSHIKELSTYNKLCKTYRYRKFYVEFDTDLETCIKQNEGRAEYKRVPERAVRKVFDRIKQNPMPEGWHKISENILEELKYRILDLEERGYESVEVFGDIHGCFEPLNEHFKKYPFDDKTFYIFCGDYIDRGIQNKECLELLFDLSKKNNVILLEGNHEKWLRLYGADKTDEIRSHEFLERTRKQLEEVDKASIREFCRKLAQIAYFRFDNKNYLVSHGGITKFPEEDKIILIPSAQFIQGVGNYETDVDNIFKENFSGTVQIHGHRNVDKNLDGNEASINLEGGVEFGGHLKVIRLCKGEQKILKYKNEVYRRIESHDFQESELIKEKVLGNGISSFNFTKDAFFKSEWNELTCKARGLFMDTVNNKVVARGYEKFFNIDEINETSMKNLSKVLKKPITLYKKENGFLGILSYVNNELMFCSKSTNDSDFARYFKEIYERSDINKEAVLEFLKDGEHSLVFEVIDTFNDPHIIEYEKSKVVLLDAIKNKLEFERVPYLSLCLLAKKFNCEVKQVYKEFDNFQEFKKWYDVQIKDNNTKDLEGVVIESGNFMCKMKFNYYLFWKYMRSCLETLRKYGRVKGEKQPVTAEGIRFYNWIIQKPELWNEDIISVRKEFYKNEY